MTRRTKREVKKILKEEIDYLLMILIGITIFILYFVRGFLGPSYIEGILANSQGIKWTVIFLLDLIVHMGLLLGPAIAGLGTLGFCEARESMEKATSRKK